MSKTSLTPICDKVPYDVLVTERKRVNTLFPHRRYNLYSQGTDENGNMLYHYDCDLNHSEHLLLIELGFIACHNTNS